ncbi:Dam family site-specific DNA-(adenine-N6)-methyltransferase [bacterium]|jgi:DNA adenine methylase|nr:Dam family site-specific DNA-(adenine-N6)-methyltransferase [bacterium]NBX72439.1 Dam family site-specific DNA-(adenine-N6)-methyltransferase [bacterium]
MNDLVVKKDKNLSPLFKWAGGKRWFMQRYSTAFNPFANLRMVEPFAGGLAFSVTLQPKHVLANDINPHLINFYNQVKEKKFFLPTDLILSKKYYYAIRAEFNDLITLNQIQGLRPAQLFWMLNRLGFNGLCRFNRDGLYNTPFGYYKKIFLQFEWSKYEEIFQSWTFTHNHFEEIKLTNNDFLFCDPPYDGAFPFYSKELFDFTQHQKLVSWIKKQGNPVLIMNHPTPRILELYADEGLEISFLMAPRTLSANMGSRGPTQELIASYNFSWKDLIKRI